MEKWNELCYILSENVPPNIDEQYFEFKVIRAFEKLGWSEYNKEIVVRESIQIGASNRISPDLIFKSNTDVNLFVVEVKKPSLDITKVNFQNQLSSYMGIMRVELGILVGNKIQIYLDGKSLNRTGIVLVEEIEFNRENTKGLKFIELFQKENFSHEAITNYALEIIQKLKNKEEYYRLEKHILSDNFLSKMNGLIRKELGNDFNKTHIDKALNNIEVRVAKKDSHILDDFPGNHKIKRELTSTQEFRISNKIMDELPIGKYIKKTFSELINKNKINNEEIVRLLNPEYSKRTFDIQFPFLAEENSKYFKKVRYWKNPYFINGKMFYVCSQWYETQANNDRPYYESWLKKMRRDN